MVYTIGYNVLADVCLADRHGAAESPAILPGDAIQAMASDASKYYTPPDTGHLRTIFAAIAADVSARSSHIR